MPRQNAVHTDGSGHTIHASDVAAPDLYLAQLSRQTYLVEEFGAKQDGVTDDTTAVQAALTAAGVTGGRVVITNPCRCAGQLSVPPFVFLDCGQAGPQRGPYGQGTSPNILGPSLLTTGNAGSTSASAAFLTLGRGSAFRGIILHPNQTQTNPPVQYPPAIVLANGAEGAILQDVLLVNPYIGVYSAGHGKPYIDGLYGQALNLGLYLDQCYDIARIRNVHWWNFWKAYVSGDPLETYQRQNLTAFYLGRVDGLHAENWLSYGHYIGVLLTQVANGPGSGAINKLWLDGGVHGVAATAVGYQGMTIRDSVIYSQYKDASNNPGYCVLVSGNATALDRLTFDGFDFNLNTTNNPSAVFVGSGVTGGRYAFRGGAFESYTSAAIVCQSTAASLSVRGTSFRGSGAILDVSTLTSSATGVYEIADCEFAVTPAYSLGASTPPGLSLGRNRLYERGVYRVGGYGAKGDGSTDDRAAIQAAIAACGAAGGGVVQLDNRTYNLSAPLTITQSGVRLVGSSRRGTKLNNTSLTTDALQLGAAGLPSHIAVEQLEISGTLAGRTGGNAITLANCGTGLTLRDLVLDNHQGGVAIGASVYEPHLDNLVLSSCTGSFIDIDPGAGTPPVDVRLRNLFLGSPSGSSAIGINMAAFAGLYASNIDITGAFAYAAKFKATTAGNSCDWGFWEQVLFDSATNSGLLFDSSSALSSTVRSQFFSQCWFSSNGVNGLEVNANTAGVRFDGIDFSQCRFQHNGHEGYHLYGNLATVFNVRFVDCVVSANSNGSSGTYNGVLVEGGFSYFTIRGGKYGLEAQGQGSDYTKSQNFGIAITTSGSGNFDISDCDVSGNINATGLTNAASATSGNWTIKDVRGYSPRGVQGPPAVPASGTALVNPYGADAMVYLAGGTVSAVSVGGAATGLTSTPASVRVAAKQSITLTYSVAPAWVWAVE